MLTTTGNRASDSSVVRLRITALALLTFAVGTTQTLKLNVIGEVALAELLLPLVALVALTNSQGRRVLKISAFWILLVSLVVTLTGYIVSDLVRESSESQYLRGWGRIALVITDFVSLCLIAGARRQSVWWFVAGMAIGRLIYLRLMLATPISLWKFSSDGYGYGEPVTLAVATLGFFLPPRIASLLFAAVGFISIHYDFRIQSAICLILAVLLWTRSRRPGQPLRSTRAMLRVAFLSLAGAAAIYIGVQLTQDDYSSQRRGVSDIGRAFGKAFALKAITNSPWIGYGSWSRSPEFERLQREAIKDVAGSEASKFQVGDSSSATHSMLLQSWVEGGILGTAFFFVLGLMLIRNVVPLVLARPVDALWPVLTYFALYGLWHIVMSAFAAPVRLQLALAATAMVVLALDRGLARGQRALRVRTAASPAFR
jgi:hypothetical protein